MELFLRVAVATCVAVMVSREVNAGCRMAGHVYEAGEVWHPILKSSTSNYCVTCRCEEDENGRSDYNCSTESCPEGCSGGPDQGECCSICSGNTSGSSGASGSGEMVGSSGRGRSVGEESFRVCVVDGMLYNHGDTFSSNYSDAEDEKCEHCFCDDGLAQCRTKTCPPVSCSSPIYTRRDCCRVCPDDSTELDWDTMVSFSDPSTPKGSSNDCKSGDRYFRNGSIWHPIIGPFGKMDCVMCKCHNGRIDCSRLKCQSKDKLQCSKPVKVAGQCCPVCPFRPTNLGPSSGRPQLPGGTSVRCLDSRSNYIVWKANQPGPTSEVVQYAFEPRDGDDNIRLHRMMLQNKSLQNINIATINNANFHELRSKINFILLGGTETKHMKRFEKRENRVKRRCDKTSQRSCNPHLTKLEKTLKIKPPHERVKCAREEKEI